MWSYTIFSFPFQWYVKKYNYYNGDEEYVPGKPHPGIESFQTKMSINVTGKPELLSKQGVRNHGPKVFEMVHYFGHVLLVTIWNGIFRS